jgi:hypothetical protein
VLVGQQLEKLVVGEDALTSVTWFASGNDVRQVVVAATRKRDSVLALELDPTSVAVVAAVLVHLFHEPPHVVVEARYRYPFNPRS